MKFASFNARCPYELGDRIKGTDGNGKLVSLIPKPQEGDGPGDERGAVKQ